MLNNTKQNRIISIHWGFIPGGVAVYASEIENVSNYAPISLKSYCLHAQKWQLDHTSIDKMNIVLLPIVSRLDLSCILTLRKILLKEKPDLILAHGFNGVFVAALSGVGFDIPIVSSWHGDYFPSTPAQKLRKPLFDALQKILFRYVVKDVVTVSRFSKEILVSKGVDEQNISVIYNGIPDIEYLPEKREEIRKSLGVPDGCFLVGTACRLASQKGLQWFLHTIALIVEIRQDVRFVIWGDGPLKNQLLTLAQSLGINGYITFAGYRSDIALCLTALDLFVMSSFAEYFSIALLEAMRAGLPIVATRVGGNPEAIEDMVHGILVPFADPQALANGVLTLLSDEKLRRNMAIQARERFQAEFTSEKMVEKTAQWLMDCNRRHTSLLAGEA
ncbi:putative glycosyltransferase [Geobacter sp. OR-1]|uniref:glycosyltransferase n=1 Tax=Geobacter sp. OR-1 TaxID=1266765 RepID=UPI000542632E|nr:glycosyltransferase [Geobacter sp. OR-1]GAM10722.1 putative glycosyltransferase [Geobacter sp. OR-1]